MAGHFQALLAGIAAAPDRPVSQIDWVPEAERRRILTVFNDTKVDYPAEQGIAGVFEAAAARWPDRQAVVFSGRSLTYRDLNRRANGLARLLGGEGGLSPEAPVGVMMARSERLPAVLLGILKAGGAYLPLDPTYPPDRIRFILSDAGAGVVVADPELAAVHDGALAGRRVIDPAEIPEGGDENPPASAGGRRLAYVIYTSGSTGRPKGSLIEHRSVLRLVINANYLTLDPSIRMLQTGSLAFDASTLEIWGPLLNGGVLVLPEEGTVTDPAALKRLIRDEGVTTLWLTASLFNQLVETDPDLFTGVHHLLVGGEKLSTPHITRVQDHHPALEVINGYGPTENTTFTTCYPIPRPAAGDIPIGRPVSNTTVYILDACGGLCPVGVPGEICTGGDGVARGYLNGPELTAEKFIPDPFSPDGGRLYRTGDLGYWRPDGVVVYMGRNDDQVKVRGYRVELSEIERALTALEGVTSAVVLARRLSADYKEMVAYFTGSGEVAVGTLRAALARSLPGYMIPSHFVRLDRFPLNANGKVDRDALPDPTGQRPDMGAAFAGPGTETERFVAAVWGEVLGLERVGVHDNFFDLGGNSLRMVRLKSRLEAVSGQTFSMAAMFRHPTVHAFSVFLEGGDDGDKEKGKERARQRSARQEALRQQRRARSKHRTVRS
jgi:tyrocidine synthetase-3